MAKVPAKDLNVGDKVRYTVEDEFKTRRSLTWTVAAKNVEKGRAKLRLERPETWLSVELHEEAPFTVTKSK